MLYLVVLCLAAAINAQVSEDVLCEGRYFEPVCPQGGTIKIVSGLYGKTDSMFCGGRDPRPWSTNCANDTSTALRESCQGKRACSVYVDGPDTCSGTSKYLQVIWSCDNVVSQIQQNDRGKNIVVSNSPSRSNPSPLHNLNVGGSQLYIILEPASDVSQVRWYLDQTTKIYTTETAAPFDLRGGRPWDSTKVPNGQHVITASITFSDGSTGRVDATFQVRNANPPQAVAARATEDKTSDFVDPGTSSTSQNNAMYVPWALFGASCLVIVALVIIIILVRRNNNNSPILEERA